MISHDLQQTRPKNLRFAQMDSDFTSGKVKSSALERFVSEAWRGVTMMGGVAEGAMYTMWGPRGHENATSWGELITPISLW